MIQILYISVESVPMTAARLLELLQQCHSRNTASGVTGMLFYGNGTFLQAIEGEETVVDALLQRIAADPRHARLQVLQRKAIDCRWYPEWSMGFRRIPETAMEKIEGLRNCCEPDFDVSELMEIRARGEAIRRHLRAPEQHQLPAELEARDVTIRLLKNEIQRSNGMLAVAALALESVTEAGKAGILGDVQARLCEAVLGEIHEKPLRADNPRPVA